MSTIAYRAGFMASDSRAYSGGSAPIGSKCKIRYLRRGWMVGVSTTIPGASERVFSWLEYIAQEEGLDGFCWANSAPALEEVGNFTALLVGPSGEAFLFENSRYPSGPIKAEFFSIGTGSGLALGAMEHGCSAAEAVRTAIKYDVWSGLPINISSDNGAISVLHS